MLQPRRALGQVPPEPPQRRSFVFRRAALSVEMDELEGVFEREFRQLAGRVLRRPQCSAFDSAAEADVGVSFRSHERMFPRQALTTHVESAAIDERTADVMRHHLHTEIDIDAPPDAVWAVLTDLDGYSDWNPFVVSSQGIVAVGEQLKNRLQPPGGRAMTFRPKVTVVETERVFEWLGRLGLPRIFDGRHRFEIESTPTRTRFVQTEAFSGVLVRFMKNSLDTQTVKGFEAMNAALKARAEARADDLDT